VRWLLITGALVMVGLPSLLAPESASALPIPIPPIGPIGPIGLGSDVVTGGLGKAGVEAFGAIIGALFSWPAKLVNRELLAWLVAVPDYAIDPSIARPDRQGSNLAELGGTTTVMAFAALGAVGTVSAIRYWAAGLTGSGGFDALEGLARTVGAALLIVLWPWLFRHSAELANEAGRGLLGSGSVLDDTARVLAAAFAAAVASNILAILVAIIAAVLFLALLVCKIAVSAATALVFVGMPLALMLWPIPELAWIARAAMRAFATVLVIPLAWAVCFATFAAIASDSLALKGASGFMDALVKPLVAIALLWVTVTLPKTLARLAMFGALNGGLVGRTASHVAARRVDAALVQAVPTTLGGQHTSVPHGEPSPDATQHGRREQAGATPSASKSSGGATGSTATVAAGTAGGAAPVAQAAKTRGWRPPPGFEDGGASRGTGLRRPPWREIEHHVPIEMAAAAQREATTTRAHVAEAMKALPDDVRRGVVDLMERKDGRIRGEMAHQAAREDLGEVEREAFRTLAAATPAVRTQGIDTFYGRPPVDQPVQHDAGGGASAAPAAKDGAIGADDPPARDRERSRRSE
jgi:hypothetical protein